MPRRTQITLSDGQHARLTTMARETGRSMSELVRRALDRTYGARGLDALESSFGAWKGRRTDGRRYVTQVRG